jgi:hypothetical protein
MGLGDSWHKVMVYSASPEEYDEDGHWPHGSGAFLPRRPSVRS